jgi:hypothetical protein
VRRLPRVLRRVSCIVSRVSCVVIFELDFLPF